ncbi:hypothetical protein, conserved [Eimeria tenella]|uniref:Uncharacterized protein n=1 Tax=Eimeria tenella TaxID=5802 RepID=U6KR65_EIMTE|nr:hypothetical protein, conserved [Eimeria tenella]CDJ40436.1 hypothetical protein, conserved [Eimeria tenella]|eukprot:XP_013231186.1 hypothetical protein, conserved [Eimeria tenella]
MPDFVGLATCGALEAWAARNAFKLFKYILCYELQRMSVLSPTFVTHWKEANSAGSVSCVPPCCARHSRATQPHVVPSVQQLGTSSTLPDASEAIETDFIENITVLTPVEPIQ